MNDKVWEDAMRESREDGTHTTYAPLTPLGVALGLAQRVLNGHDKPSSYSADDLRLMAVQILSLQKNAEAAEAALEELRGFETDVEQLEAQVRSLREALQKLLDYIGAVYSGPVMPEAKQAIAQARAALTTREPAPVPHEADFHKDPVGDDKPVQRSLAHADEVLSRAMETMLHMGDDKPDPREAVIDEIYAISAFAGGNGDVCEVIARRLRKLADNLAKERGR